MSKTKLLPIVIFALILGGIFSCSVSRAQEAMPESVSLGEIVAVAEVNIFDAKIVSQEENKIRISFDLANGESVQPEVKYAVRLIRSSETEQVVVDEKIYEEVLDLKNGETLKKEIEYSAPAYLEGTFQLWLMAQNQSGLDLSLSNAGEISLMGNNRYIEIIPESCYLKVEGEAEDVRYSLFQGVDIKSEEKLLAVCELANHFADPVEFTPVIKNYWRSTFGKAVEDDKAPQVSLGLASGEKRSFYFVIPKALTPQAYDAVLELTDKQGKIISNKLSFHYVLRGASATIQNLRLDKDYYLKGETARASIYWTPAADNFYGARFAPTDNGKVFLEIAIKSAAGNLCTEKYDKEADPGARTSDYDLPVTSNCVDPRIIVSIKDGQGNILDQKEYALKSQDVPVGAGLEKEEVQKEDEKYDPIFLYASILGAILAIALLAVVFHRRKSVSLFIFFILGTAIFAHGNNASAATFVVQSINYSHSDSVYTVNLNKSVFLPGENITAYGTGKGGVCRNGDLFQYLAVSSTDGTNSVSKPIIDIYADAGHWFVANGTQDWQCTGDSGRFSHQICNYITNGHIKFASSGTDGNHRVVFLGKGWGSHAYLPVRYNVTGKACTLPWGGTIASGKSVTAYKSNLLPCGSTCVKQTRTCNNGKLSGSYINKNCSVQACAAPVLNFSATPTSVTSGTATTLTWSTKNVSGNCYGTSNVANDGGWTPNNAVSTDRSSKSGSGATQSVSPTATTTYALECWNGAGVSAKKTVTVSVASPAPANPCASIDPIAGRCGVADGQAYLTAPASNLLCSSGNPSPASLSGSGPWNWTCNGICSTSNASCSASQSVDLNWKEVNPN